MSDNHPLDIAKKIVETTDRIHAALNRERLQHEETELDDFLDKVPNSREQWKRDRRTGEQYYDVSREGLLAMLGVTEADLEQVPVKLREEFEADISEYFREQKAGNIRVQFKISLSPNEKRLIEQAAQMQGVSWSEYAALAAVALARTSICLAQEIGSEKLSMWHLGKLVAAGLNLWDAFTPDEVEKAIAVAGLDYATGKKLMAELERLRDARMNPEAGSMDIPE